LSLVLSGGEGRPVRKRARVRGGDRSGISRRRAAAQRSLSSSRWTGAGGWSFAGLPPFSHQEQWPQGWGICSPKCGGQEGGLAAIVGGEGQNLVETGDLPGLSFESALVEGARQGVQVVGPAEPAFRRQPNSGTDRFRQILRAKISEISLCRGIASTAPVVGFVHRECEPPSRFK
jgi:hypothetical protein